MISILRARCQMHFCLCTQGMAGAVTEVLAMTSFVYLVLPEISPGVGILLLCGVFFFQICVDIVKTPNSYCGQNTTISCGRGQRNGYDAIHRQKATSSFWSKVWGFFEKTFRVLLANRIAKVVALLLQIVGMFGFIGLWIGMTKDKHYDMVRPMVGYPLVVFALSVIWSNFFQEKIAGAEDKYNKTRVVTARFKSSKFDIRRPKQSLYINKVWSNLDYAYSRLSKLYTQRKL